MSTPTRKTGRPAVSCVACRKSKLKCNKVFPCSECIRRGCAELCPTGVLQHKLTVRELVKENHDLKQRLSLLAEGGPGASVANANGLHGSSLGTFDQHLNSSFSLPNVGDLSYNGSFSTLPTPLRTPDSAQPSSSAQPYPSSHDNNVGQLDIEASGSSRYYGALAHVHVLPDDEDAEGRPLEETQLDVRSTSALDSSFPGVFPFSAHDSQWATRMITEARTSLPTYDLMDRWLSLYWQASCWRFEPIARETLDPIVLTVYGNIAEANPLQMAVIFAAIAFGCLFDGSLQSHSSEAQRYHRLSMACLSAGNFMSNTSVATLAALHLHCCFLLNDSTPATAEIFAIVGLAVRLATIAGFHRDPALWNLPQKEVDARRRVWCDLVTLESIQAARFGCPSSTNKDHYDTKRPDDVGRDKFLWWRWEADGAIFAVITELASLKISEQVGPVANADRKLRELWSSLPIHLRCPIINGSIPSKDWLAGPAFTGNVSLAMQQIRLGFVFLSGLWQLHRPALSKALRDCPEEPLRSEHHASVRTVIQEVCVNIIALAEALYNHDKLLTRHTLVNLDLFSCLVPLAAVVGISLLEFAYEATPSEWLRMLTSRAHRLASRATLRFASRYSSANDSSSTALEDVDSMLGSGTRLRERASAAPGKQSMTASFSVDTSSLDFDRWLQGCLTTEAPSAALSLSEFDTMLFGPNFIDP